MHKKKELNRKGLTYPLRVIRTQPLFADITQTIRQPHPFSIDCGGHRPRILRHL